MSRNQLRVIVYSLLMILSVAVLWKAGYFSQVYESWVRLLRFAG